MKSKSKKYKNTKTASILMLLLIILIAELFCYTWCRVQCIEAGYKIEKEKKQYEKLKQLQKSLRIELARRKAPDRIMQIAKNDLGLVMPGFRHKVTIR